MSFDQSLLAEIVEAAAQAGLQVILIGNVAAIVHGVPVLTRDVDFMDKAALQILKETQKVQKAITREKSNGSKRRK